MILAVDGYIHYYTFINNHLLTFTPSKWQRMSMQKKIIMNDDVFVHNIYLTLNTDLLA